MTRSGEEIAQNTAALPALSRTRRRPLDPCFSTKLMNGSSVQADVRFSLFGVSQSDDDDEEQEEPSPSVHTEQEAKPWVTESRN